MESSSEEIYLHRTVPKALYKALLSPVYAHNHTPANYGSGSCLRALWQRVVTGGIQTGDRLVTRPAVPTEPQLPKLYTRCIPTHFWLHWLHERKLYNSSRKLFVEAPWQPMRTARFVPKKRSCDVTVLKTVLARQSPPIQCNIFSRSEFESFCTFSWVSPDKRADVCLWFGSGYILMLK